MTAPRTPLRREYVFGVLIGIGLAVWSALADFNPLAFFAGLLLGGSMVALDRECKK